MEMHNKIFNLQKKMLLEFTSFSIKIEVYIFKRVFPRIK